MTTTMQVAALMGLYFQAFTHSLRFTGATRQGQSDADPDWARRVSLGSMQRTSIGPRKAGEGGGGGSTAAATGVATGAAARPPPPPPSSSTFTSAAARADGGKISHGILSLALVQER
jgi:hypothetical protein|eukprot:evm.model.NODE_17024_length_4090_cov_9.734963.1